MQREVIVKYMRHKFEFVHEQELRVIFDNFCKWGDELYSFGKAELLPFQEEFNQILLEEKNKDWCKSLCKRQQDEIRAMEERNAKIRKIEKKPQALSFFTDENVLIYILQFLNLHDFQNLRNTSLFFKQFLATHYTQLFKHLKFRIGFTLLSDSPSPEVDVHEVLDTANYYRTVCLLSGVEASLIEKLVVAKMALQSILTQEFVAKQFLELLHSTINYFSNIFLLNMNWVQYSLANSLGKLQLQNIPFPISMGFPYAGVPITPLNLSKSPFQIFSCLSNLDNRTKVADFINFVYQSEYKHPVYIIISARSTNTHNKEECFKEFEILATKEHLRMFLFCKKEVMIQQKRFTLKECSFAPPGIPLTDPEICAYYIRLLLSIKEEVDEIARKLIDELINITNQRNEYFV